METSRIADAIGLGWASALPWDVKAMLVVLGARLLATGFDVGVGTVGGVFTPTMFAGATLGALAAHALGYGGASDAVVLFAIFGLSALIAAATHAPLMASCMAAELTGHWRLWPLLVAVDVLAWLVARSLSPAALYAIASQEPVHKGLAAPHSKPQAQQAAPAALVNH